MFAFTDGIIISILYLHDNDNLTVLLIEPRVEKLVKYDGKVQVLAFNMLILAMCTC